MNRNNYGIEFKNMGKGLLLKLYNQPETVFTVDEIAQLMPQVTPASLLDRLYYFTKVGKLRRLRHGIYAKANYEPLELATKVYKPSYISLETVLFRAGIIFQSYDRIFAVSYVTREVTVDTLKIQYRKIRPDVLVNTAGLENKTDYFIATTERAFLDAVFIYKNYHFDNLGPLDWAKVTELKKIYASKILDKRVDDYARH